MKPTIGRVVLVHSNDSISDQSEPALICYVHSDILINVGGFDRNGIPFSETSLTLLGEDEVAIPGVRCAEWMPYQKKVAKEQAAKESETQG